MFQHKQIKKKKKVAGEAKWMCAHTNFSFSGSKSLVQAVCHTLGSQKHARNSSFDLTVHHITHFLWKFICPAQNNPLTLNSLFVGFEKMEPLVTAPAGSKWLGTCGQTVVFVSVQTCAKNTLPPRIFGTVAANLLWVPSVPPGTLCHSNRANTLSFQFPRTFPAEIVQRESPCSVASSGFPH